MHELWRKKNSHSGCVRLFKIFAHTLTPPGPVFRGTPTAKLDDPPLKRILAAAKKCLLTVFIDSRFDRRCPSSYQDWILREVVQSVQFSLASK